MYVIEAVKVIPLPPRHLHEQHTKHMPANEKRHTLLRQWELLKSLPSYQQNPTGVSTKEIQQRLQEAGFEVDLRTIQRDLQELSALFPIDANDTAKPYGWRWSKDAHLSMPGLTVGEAVALKLVEDHLRQLLPPTLLRGMSGLFRQANNRLDALHGENPTADWPPKVKAVTAAQPMAPPEVDESIQTEVSRALLEGRQIKVLYRPATSEVLKEYRLHPLGLVLRGSVLYLVATAFDYQDARTYALHRFENVEILLDLVEMPDGFDLDQELSKGMAEFGDWGEPMTLELLCHPDLAFHLGETALSKDQTLTPDASGSVRVTATVNNTWQLRWWLLSQGAKVQVLSPDGLVDEIAAEARETARLYS